MEIGAIVWMGQLMFRLFSQQKKEEEIFIKYVCNNASLEALGFPGIELLIVLGVATSSLFLLTLA